MKKLLSIVFMMIFVCLYVTLLTGCECDHEWSEATCELLATCTKCGKTMGEYADHEWSEATCLSPKKCTICGKTEGGLGAHSVEKGICPTCGRATVSFSSVYSECNCKSPWAKAGYDYLTIDTNPYDYEDNPYVDLATTYAEAALNAIKKINEKLSLPSYLIDEMLETRAVDGRRTYSGKKVNVSWRYHPDNGLEVRYSF